MAARQAARPIPPALSPARLRPMEAKLVDFLPEDGIWQFEPKWDGFRCLVFRDGDKVQLIAKSGKPLSRYFPEMVAAFAAVKPTHFILDGELLIPSWQYPLFRCPSNAAASRQSRIDKLAAETPALFMAFDILADDKGETYLDKPVARPPHGAGDSSQTPGQSRSFAAIAFQPEIGRCAEMVGTRRRRGARRRDRQTAR